MTRISILIIPLVGLGYAIWMILFSSSFSGDMFCLIKFTNLSGETTLILLSKRETHFIMLSTELDQLCTAIKLYPFSEYGFFD